MTYDEAMAMDAHSPILLSDGSFGLVTHVWETGLGVQVPGEENIRRLPLETVRDLGDGALREVAEVKVTKRPALKWLRLGSNGRWNAMDNEQDGADLAAIDNLIRRKRIRKDTIRSLDHLYDPHPFEKKPILCVNGRYHRPAWVQMTCEHDEPTIDQVRPPFMRASTMIITARLAGTNQIMEISSEQGRLPSYPLTGICSS